MSDADLLIAIAKVVYGKGVPVTHHYDITDATCVLCGQSAFGYPVKITHAPSARGS